MSVSTCPSESSNAASPASGLDELDRAIVLSTQAGLPLVPDPWGRWASRWAWPATRCWCACDACRRTG
ncbi:hypothetical protein [Billgrantia tianxiuensis]|uniref:hypothetical protein n=1 Tax=Billgrantia tianxiuensis TaxID=2497861 RepID=UPI0019163DFD|nr:hypothetical protein [Halomonas tianxiuensis]